MFPIAKQEPAPFPELMPRDQADASGPIQPAALRPHAPRHAGKMAAMMPANAPNESNRITLPTYTLRPPDVLIIESRKGLTTQPIFGQHLVRPDGTVGLGAYPAVKVAGLTLEEARVEIAKAIHSKMAKEPYKIEDPPGSKKFIEIKPPTEKEVRDNLSVDVLAYNSSVYYIITDGAGLGQQVYRFPITGSETVLDAISNINGLPVVASPRRIWVARRSEGPGAPDSKLAVDWKGITQLGGTNTNWQVMPGDRIYVQADPMRTFNTNLGKFLEPVERVIGATLLTGQTVNTIRNGTTVIR
jgi:polysaccharide export outer membrane protein